MRARRAAGDRGTTLVEVLVAMVVFGVFATMVASTVLQTTRLTRESGVRNVSAQRASTLMQQLTKDLRTAVRLGTPADATAFVTARPDRVDFYSSVTPQILLESLCAQAACELPLPSGAGLHRARRTPDPTSTYPELTFTSSTPERRRLEDGAVATSSVFSYRLRDGSTATTVTGAGLKDIVAVTVRVALDGDGPGRLPPVVLESTVRPYNP